MDQLLDWSVQFSNLALTTITGVIEFLPLMLGALAILLAGGIVAWLSKLIMVRLLKGVNRIHRRIQIAGTPILPKISEPLVLVVARIVFWFIILLFVAWSTDLLGLGLFADWLSRLVNHLPSILSGVLIIWAGIVFSGLIGQTITTTATNLPDSQRIALSKVAQFFVLVMLILIGVEQIGVNVSIVTLIVSVIIGAVLGSLAIAFGFGARALVSNLIGVRYLNSEYRLGQKIMIGSYEGTIIEMSSVAVILDTAQGRVTIPAHMFSNQPSVLVAQDSENV